MTQLTAPAKHRNNIEFGVKNKGLVLDATEDLLSTHGFTVDVLKHDAPYVLPHPLQIAGIKDLIALSPNDIEIRSDDLGDSVYKTIDKVLENNDLHSPNIRQWPIYRYDKAGYKTYTTDTMSLPLQTINFVGFAFVNRSNIDTNKYAWHEEDDMVLHAEALLHESLDIMAGILAWKYSTITLKRDGQEIITDILVENTAFHINRSINSLVSQALMREEILALRLASPSEQ